MDIKIRGFRESDLAQLLIVAKKAFAGFPWFEELSDATVRNRWESHVILPGFRCLVAEAPGVGIVGGHWASEITIASLEVERGCKLADWASSMYPCTAIVWERELVVEPRFQRLGIGRRLRGEFLAEISAGMSRVLILTRLRDDNVGSIRGAEHFGFARTGVTKPASQAPLIHEYWYLLV